MMNFDWIETAFKMVQVMVTDGKGFAEAVSEIFDIVNVDEKYADIGGIMNVIAEGKLDAIVNG